MINGISIYRIIPQGANAAKKIVGMAKTQRQQISQGIKEGIEAGRRLAVQQEMGTIKTAQTKLVGIKRALPPELWYGFLGTITPVPGGSIIGVGIGRLVKLLKKQH